MSDRHDCLWTGRGCNSATEEDGEAKPALTEKPDDLCPGCWKSLERGVEQAAETFVRLHAAIGDKNMRRGQRVSGTMNPPIPLNVDVAAAMDRLVEWLVVGALRIADAMNMDDSLEPESRITTEQARVTEKCCNLLKPNLQRLIQSGEDAVTVWRKTGESTDFRDMTGADIALEIERANWWGRKLLDPGERQDFACPLCHARAVFRLVYWTSGGKHRDLVECHNCGKGWEYESYQTICNVALRAIEEERMAQETEDLRRRVKELEEAETAAEVKAADYGRRIAYIRNLTEIDPQELNVEIVLRVLREDVLGEAA